MSSTSTSRQVAGLKILFGKNYDKWSWNQEQLSYTTPVYIAEKIAEMIKRIYNFTDDLHQKKTIKIWDMFAGLGVDSICLGLERFEVHATELSNEIYELFKKNITSFSLDRGVVPIQGDCLDKIPAVEKSSTVIEGVSECTNKYDIVYFDPPWGDSFNGNKIFDFTEITLSNGVFVVDLLREIYDNYTRKIVIKSPLKCNTFENLDFIKIERVVIFRKHHLKFIITS